MAEITEYLHHPIVQGAISGFVAAAAVDFAAFKKFQTKEEFASYSWSVAAFRWVQGAVVGAVTAAGLGVVA